MDCSCAAQLGLWKTVENPCGQPSESVENPRPRAPGSPSLNSYKSLSDSKPRTRDEHDLITALINANETLIARIDGLELLLHALTGEVRAR